MAKKEEVLLSINIETKDSEGKINEFREALDALLQKEQELNKAFAAGKIDLDMYRQSIMFLHQELSVLVANLLLLKISLDLIEKKDLFSEADAEIINQLTEQLEKMLSVLNSLNTELWWGQINTDVFAGSLGLLNEQLDETNENLGGIFDELLKNMLAMAGATIASNALSASLNILNDILKSLDERTIKIDFNFYPEPLNSLINDMRTLVSLFGALEDELDDIEDEIASVTSLLVQLSEVVKSFDEIPELKIRVDIDIEDEDIERLRSLCEEGGLKESIETLNQAINEQTSQVQDFLSGYRSIFEEIRSIVSETSTHAGGSVTLLTEIRDLLTSINQAPPTGPAGPGGISGFTSSVNNFRGCLDNVMPVSIDFINTLSEMGGAFRNANTDAGGIGQTFGNLSGGIGNLGKVFRGANTDAGGLGNTFGSLSGNVSDFTSEASQSSKGFGSSMASMGTSAKGFGASLKALAANPVGAVMMAIQIVMDLLQKAMDGNSQSSEKLRQVMDQLGKSFGEILNSLQPLIDLIIDYVTNYLKLYVAGIQAVTSAWDSFLDLFRSDEEIERMKETKKRQDEIVKSEKELAKAEKELAKEHRKLKKETEALQEVQNDTTKSYDERIKAIDDLERANDRVLQKELQVAKKELETLNRRIEDEGEIADLVEKQAAALARVDAAEDGINKNIKARQKEKDAINKESQDKARQAGQDAARRKKERDQKDIQETRALEDAKLAIMEEGLDKLREETTRSYDRQKEDLEKRLREEGDLSEKARKAIKDRILLIEQQKEAELAKITKEAAEKRAAEHLEHLNQELSMIQETSDRALEIKKEQHQKEWEAALEYAEKNKDLNIDINAVNAKFAAEAKKVEEDHKKAVYQELLANQKKNFENKLNAIVAEGIAEKQMKLKLKQDELAAMAQLEGESDAEYKARRKALADEVKTDEETLFTSRLEELKTKGQTENEAKLQLKQEELANLSELKNLTDEERKQKELELLEEEKTLKQQVLQEEFDTASAKVQVYQQMFDGMGSILEEFGANSAALGVFSKAMALADIGINTAKAISAGVASAQTVPFPGNIAAVITTIGSIMTNVATAKKLLSKEKTPEAPKFASGGLVTGEGSGTSDSITARLSSGESVITAMGTQMFGPMLSAFNQIGGGVPIASANSGQQAIGQEMLTEAFRKALNSMPTPVVAVSEINDVNKRVEVLESYGSL